MEAGSFGQIGRHDGFWKSSGSLEEAKQRI
jgi:hypothetical protein